MVPDIERSLQEGALDPREKPRYSKERRALAVRFGLEPGRIADGAQFLCVVRYRFFDRNRLTHQK